MKSKTTLFVIFFICLLYITPSFGQKETMPPTLLPALNNITPDEIKSDIQFLADDKLAGRFPGTDGYQQAIDYVIDKLKTLKVEPLGEDGTWLQTVRLRNAKITSQFFVIKYDDGKRPEEARSDDFVIYPNPVVTSASATAPLVFAGYGICEPTLKYDDYIDLDVKGKIVLVARGAPDKFPSAAAAHLSSTNTILKTAAEHGAIGVIISNADSTRKTLPDMSKGVYSVLDKDGGIAVSRTYYNTQIKILAMVSYNMLNKFFETSGKNTAAILAQLKEGVPQSAPLSVSIGTSYSSEYHDITSYNIIGKITGSDNTLENEYIVHSAHLDHLGIGKPVQGDSLYNGAHDNASGVASLLGIAKIYKKLKAKPKRSIVLLFVTGEEMGLLGSGYFAKYPTIPVQNIVANINTDMPTIIAPLLSITALGAEHSSLIKQVNQAAGYLGLEVQDDPEPKQARFTRSDQYSFVLNGVPALHIKYGNKTADGKNNLNDLVATWREKYYHKPQDDINGLFDFEAGVKYAQLNFLIGYLVAQDDLKPTWNQGDLFGQK
jgi:Zn-dependent M28 family amino/carboxypeptidase